MKQAEISAVSKLLRAELIADILAETGRESKRSRKLPAPLVMWLVIGMGLYRDLSIGKVLERISVGLNWRPWTGKAPHATSITAARDRLGWEPVRLLFRRFAAFLVSRFKSATLWRGHEVFTLDGTCLLTPDMRANERWFGRPLCARGGHSGFPQLRAVLLVGVWSHLVVHAVFGPYTTSEMQLADYALSWLTPGSVLLVDRAYYGFRWATLFVRRGVHFVV